MIHARREFASRIARAIKTFALLAMTSCPASSAAFAQMPFRPDHVVIVIEENRAYSEIIGQTNPATGAPYINSLAAGGAVFTNSYATDHPSQPNYLQLYSGSNQDMVDDSRPPAAFTTPNLGAELFARGLTFGGYAETMPSVGFNGDLFSTVSGQLQYWRVCNPWVNWQGAAANAVPVSANMPFANFPSDYSSLPTVSLVVPNLQNDMHSNSILQGDLWLKDNLDGYVQWAKTHNSLLIVTWDEDDYTAANQIPTIFFGPMVRTGQYGEFINHYNVLRTVEDLYGLGYAGASATAVPITDAFVTSHSMTWNKSASGNWSESQWTNSPPTFPDQTVDAVLNSVLTVTVDGSYTVHSLTIGAGTSDVPATRSLTTLVGVDVAAAATLHVAGTFTAQVVQNNGTVNITDGGNVSVAGIGGSGDISVTGNSVLTAGFIRQNSLTIGSAGAAVPEPTALALLGLGSVSVLTGVWLRRRRYCQTGRP